MSKVIAIIGSGYGDEGKGLMTDYFSSQYNDAIVIRSNGGAQAGHTVVRPNGDRHIFSHFGSGTLNGTPTYLSKHFICNPFLFAKEYKLVQDNFGISPKVYIDPEAIISTPYDMLINQQHEFERGDELHGSCGVGFGETIERQLLHSSLSMGYVDMLYDNAEEFSFVSAIENIMIHIRNNYVHTRLKTTNPVFEKVIMDDDRIAAFNAALFFMLKNTTLAEAGTFADSTLIFEGAQGLLLDMDYGFFPYVTRSNCGMKNISNILSTIPTNLYGEHDVTVNYVRRAYTTRHGAGPLNNEMSLEDMGHDIVDETNIPNQFQGTLRFGDMDESLFNSITDKDFMNYAPRGSKKTVTTTCMDQLGEEVGMIEDNHTTGYSKERFTEMMTESSDYLSYGQTCEDVKQLDK